jgi:hypothetical protein
MKDIDLKTIFIGIFVLAFIFFGFKRMDVGRYVKLSEEENKFLFLMDSKNGDIYIHISDTDLTVPDQFWIKHKGGGVNDAVTPAEYSALLEEQLLNKQKEKEKKEN